MSRDSTAVVVLHRKSQRRTTQSAIAACGGDGYAGAEYAMDRCNEV
jgi:hypothetical protein